MNFLKNLKARVLRSRGYSSATVRASTTKTLSGTDEAWFQEDLAQLDASNPDWNRESLIADAQRWLSKGKDLDTVRRIFGKDIAEEAARRGIAVVN
jgi:hypothetical protein